MKIKIEREGNPKVPYSSLRVGNWFTTGPVEGPRLKLPRGHAIYYGPKLEYQPPLPPDQKVELLLPACIDAEGTLILIPSPETNDDS